MPCVLQASLGCTDTNGRYSVASFRSSASDSPSPSVSVSVPVSGPASDGPPDAEGGVAGGGAFGPALPPPGGAAEVSFAGDAEHAAATEDATAMAKSFAPMAGAC